MALIMYPLPILLGISALLFAKHVLFNRRYRQWPGLAMAVLALPLFVLYYDDRLAFPAYPLREAARPLADLTHGNADFISSLVPLEMLGGLYFIRIVVYLRLSFKSRMKDINESLAKVIDRVVNFFAFTTIAILLSGIVVSTFALGWIGSVCLAGGFALLYMGIIGIFADTVSLTRAASALGSVVLERRLLWVITVIARVTVWTSDLYRAFRFNLQTLIRRIRAKELEQRAGLANDKDQGDDKLTRAQRRRMRRSAADELNGVTGDLSAE